jgi:NAD(P)-dependent dehydrogenase (short-subunit alcohol dehydrogenase family)
MSGRLAGKVALITGAAGGIGRATVCRFLEEGAAIVAVDLSVDALVEDYPAVSLAIAADVTQGIEVEEAFARADAALGAVDVLFNVAGASGRRMGDGPVDQCTEEGWDWTLGVNLRSVFLCCKHAIPIMRRRGGGSIINLGSVLGLGGDPDFDTHAYAAAKGAVLSLTRAMAVKYAPEQIRVNAIAPGLIRTPMSLRAQGDERVRERLAELQPLTGDFGEAEDVAAAALYLASDESRFVTGTVLPVDGGWSAR